MTFLTNMGGTGLRLGMTPSPSFGAGGIIRERNDEGKPSATHVSGKPGSVLPKELLVHLQEVTGEEREREVLKAVNAISKKSAPSNGFIDASAILQAQIMSMNPFSQPMTGFDSPL